jgi:hypothetical protein
MGLSQGWYHHPETRATAQAAPYIAFIEFVFIFCTARIDTIEPISHVRQRLKGKF